MTTEICLDLKYNDLRQVSCIGLAGGSCFLILFHLYLTPLSSLFADFAASYPSRRPFYVHDIWCISVWFTLLGGIPTSVGFLDTINAYHCSNVYGFYNVSDDCIAIL